MRRRNALLLGLALLPTPALADDPAPKGEVKRYTFAASKVFPGTTRDYWVYVPRQYDPAKPACLFVNQDGVQNKAPEVFDDLIAKKEMPVTIGVFVQPGKVLPKVPDAQPRFNRSFEYDGLGDAYARFLIDELLPDVESKTAEDGRPIRLSKDGNDRAIGGSSSGAIAAFTAAWERPDSFRRVFSTIGTYVGLRGGNIYPTLIRKYEPKPLRIFLQDGSNDLNIYGGDWWMANQEMERALAFAGYEVDHAWGTGGHDGKQAAEVFPGAMRWLWRDHPGPVKAGAGSPQLRDILIPGEDWTLVSGGYQFTEGPIANAAGEVIFDDIPTGKAYKIGPDGKPSVFIEDTKNTNGQAFGPDGRLYACATKTSEILVYDKEMKPTVLATGIRGNDLTVGRDGGVYVTHPSNEPGRVWYISPKGETRLAYNAASGGGINIASPNGLAFSPDQSLLYVADARSHWIYSFSVQPDGALVDGQKFFHLHTPDSADNAAPDGVRVDAKGRVYVATRIGIQVCDEPGRVNAIIPLPTSGGGLSNLCFGGPDLDVIYATAVDRVFKRKVRARGVLPFQPPTKLPTPSL